MPEVKQPKLRRCASCGKERQRLRTIYSNDVEYKVCGVCYNQYATTHTCSECHKVDISIPQRSLIRYVPDVAKRIFAKGLGRKLCKKCAIDIVLKYKPFKMKQCRVCSCLFIPSKSQVYCDECSEKVRTCVTCKKVYTDSLWIDRQGRTRDSNKECPDCHRKKTCRLCANDIEKGVGLCSDCASQYKICEHCGKVQRKTNKKCRNCEPRVICRACGESVEATGYRYHNRHINVDSRFTCIKCAGSPIMPWNYKRPVRFFGDGGLRFGIENEYEFDYENFMEHTDKLRYWVAKRHSFWHLVHDGSLQYGVEMVSQPATFEYMMEHLKLPPVPNHSEMCTAGCHIHMDKSQFTQFHLFKFVKFLGSNFDALRDIFGRGIWDKIGPVLEGPIEFIKKSPQLHARYNWINLKPDKTVEIRVFAGTDNEAVLKSYIQFLHAAYFFTKNTSIGCLELDKFIIFIKGKNEYRLLRDRIDAVGSSLLRYQYGDSGEAIGKDTPTSLTDKYITQIVDSIKML